MGMLVAEMSPEEQSATASQASARPPQRGGSSRGRRTFRPERRPRRPSPAPVSEPAPAPEPTPEPTAELPAAEIADSGAPMSANVGEPPEPVAERERERASEPSTPSAPVPATAIRQAIEEILRINKDLEWVLLEMEKALETLEEAEVQKYADEREIESLKNAMRQLGRTRDAVQRVQQGGQRRPEDSRRGRHSNREHREHRGEHREHRERRDQRHQSHHHAEQHHEHVEPRDVNASTAGHEHESHSEPPEPEIPV